MDFFLPNHQLKDLPADQAHVIHSGGARDLGKRGGIVVFVYQALILFLIAGSAEIRSYIHLTGPVAGVLFFISIYRFYLSKKLVTAIDENIEHYLSRYGFWALAGAFVLGLFAAIVIYKSGFSKTGFFMILVMCAITSGAIGTFNLFFRAWSTFIVLLWILVIVASIATGLRGDMVGYSVALGSFFYMTAIILLGKRFADEYWRAQIGVIELDHKMRELESALKLVEAKEGEIRDHRDHLQQMVENKTRDLRLAKEAAETANQAKDEFLTNMSHELRTPLHAIQSFSQLGLKKLETAPLDKLGGYFARVQTNGKRLTRLIDNLLDLSKLEASKMVFDFRQVELHNLIENCVEEFEATFVEKRLKVSVVPVGFDTHAVIDGFRIEQVVINLLSNAVKFSLSDKTITLSISKCFTAQGNRKADLLNVPALCLSVRDEGMGIPEDELESVFDKFIQSSDTKSGAGGTGLGLAICKEIIEQHDGLIWAQNSPDGGAELTFSIPINGPRTYIENQDSQDNRSSQNSAPASEPMMQD